MISTIGVAFNIAIYIKNKMPVASLRS